MKKKETLLNKIIQQLKKHKVAFIIYIVLQALVVLTLIRSFLRGEYESVLICILTMILLLIPPFIERTFNIKLPTTLICIILFFIYAAEILGEINAYYIKFENWDTILHTTNGFLCAAIGIGIIDVLNSSSKTSLKLSPIYVAIAAFCFSMTIGVLWEFFEYSADLWFLTDMQKDTIIHSLSSVDLNPNKENIPIIIKGITSVAVNGKELPLNGYLDIGLHDTMFDLFVNFLGAIAFSIIGFFYVKEKGKNKIAKEFIITVGDKKA